MRSIMVTITKYEAELLREYLPNVKITITNQYGKAKEKNRYVEEASAAMSLLERIRSGELENASSNE